MKKITEQKEKKIPLEIAGVQCIECASKLLRVVGCVEGTTLLLQCESCGALLYLFIREVEPKQFNPPKAKMEVNYCG